MTAAESDRAALLRAILCDPDDDLPRLAYADWLEENGDQGGRAYAGMIRAQLEADTPVAIAMPDGKIVRRWEVITAYRERVEAAASALPVAFFRDHFPAVLLPFKVNIWHPRRQLEEKLSSRSFADAYLSLSRGMACHVETVLEKLVFPGCLEELFARHPITSVELSDKRPYHGRSWVRLETTGRYDASAANRLPALLFDGLAGWRDSTSEDAVIVAKHYRDEAEAVRGLSEILVRRGRELAGLPPLGAKT